MHADHPYAYRRLTTRVVSVGDVALGGTHPIRVQSMTTPATTDTRATVDQIARLVEAGCEIVRVTVPSRADADNLPHIRREMARRRLRVPLVADIHFTPAAAMRAVEHVEKVRINPGNFADKKRFETREYTDAEYAAELERIAERFLPLVRRARELGVAMRIGTNHGSLSDRILNRHGDTPEGMVESALEFVRLARCEGYHQLVLSMKSSNPLVAIEAYRLLVRRMAREGGAYPLHLGVTEAGDGEDGRIKSAVGIGALLDEGLGDTVRVSLTEDPVAEIPVAFALVRPYNERLATHPRGVVPDLASAPPERPRGLRAGRRPTRRLRLGGLELGGGEPVRHEMRLRTGLHDTARLHQEIAEVAGWALPERLRTETMLVRVDGEQDARALVALRALLVEHGVRVPLAAELSPGLVLEAEKLAGLLGAVQRVSGLPPPALARGPWEQALRCLARQCLRAGIPYLAEASPAEVPAFVSAPLAAPGFEGPVDTLVEAVRLARAEGAEALAACFTTGGPGPAAAVRLLAARLDAVGLDVPLLGVHRPPPGDQEALLRPSVELGALLADGLLDAVRVETTAGAARDLRFTWSLLQAARQRTVKAEFISCPSCGRTLFDLESTTRQIKERTAHLTGVKIAIMGCIVNGPGEMADADFGYVGWGPGKVALFVGKDLVEREVPASRAVERLIQVIRERGRWVEPPRA